MADIRTTGSNDKSGLTIASLTLVAILLAAGFVLNLTVGKAFAIVGIQPQFIISSYCLAILLLRPNLLQSLGIGLFAATIVQLTASFPFVNYLSDVPAALCMGAMVRLLSKSGKLPLLAPGATAALTTLVSGLIFAYVASYFILQFELKAFMTMLPIVGGTTLANAIVVQLLYMPLARVFARQS